MSNVHEVEMFKMRQRLNEGRKSFTDDMALFLKLAPLDTLLPELEVALKQADDIHTRVAVHDAHAVLGELDRLATLYKPIVQQPHGPARMADDREWCETLNRMLGLSNVENQ